MDDAPSSLFHAPINYTTTTAPHHYPHDAHKSAEHLAAIVVGSLLSATPSADSRSTNSSNSVDVDTASDNSTTPEGVASGFASALLHAVADRLIGVSSSGGGGDGDGGRSYMTSTTAARTTASAGHVGLTAEPLLGATGGSFVASMSTHISTTTSSSYGNDSQPDGLAFVGTNGTAMVEVLAEQQPNNYWALLALVLVVGTAAGNILVCLAITRERRLQNITNYFLMSLAITDLMVAVLVMPLGILTLYKGE